MRLPDFTELSLERADRQASGRLTTRCLGGSLHPRPDLYKHYWWIFWSGSPVDGIAFLSDRYRLTTFAMVELTSHLAASREPYWIYTRKYPRLDPQSPFDRNHELRRNQIWTPSYAEDTDTAWISPDGTAYK